MQYSILSKWMHSLVLNDDFCALEDCGETEQRLGSVEEECWERELTLWLEAASQEIDPRPGGVEEVCVATVAGLGDTEEVCVEAEPRLVYVEEDCEATEPGLGLQEAVDDFEVSEQSLRLELVEALEQSLEVGLDAWVDVRGAVELHMVPKLSKFFSPACVLSIMKLYS